MTRRIQREPKIRAGDVVDAEIGNLASKRWIRGGEVKRTEKRDNGVFEFYVAYVKFPENSEIVVYAEDQLLKRSGEEHS